MSITVSSMLSATAAVTMASAVLSSASWGKFPYVDAMASPAMWNAPAAKFVRRNRVASTVKPLDLRKLTMSDFGDVEGPR